MPTAAPSASSAASSTTPEILLVAGPGRSGTSLFTSLTGALGLYIPKPEVQANRSNPRGFGEPRWAVDFHNELLGKVDVLVDDGRPEAWALTDEVAEDDKAAASLTAWLAEQLDESTRVVVKDPRLGWFLALYGRAADTLGAELRVATLLRHPAEVLRSRELAYGYKTSNTTRVTGWMNMMLGTEARTRDLPRATVRYDDLLTDWRSAVGEADSALGLGLLGDPEREAAADELVDPSLHRSHSDWADLGLPPTALHLARRVYDTYGRLVGVPVAEQGEVRAELDALAAELSGWYDECFDVARSRTGSRIRAARRQAARRARQEAEAGRDPQRRGLGRVREAVQRRLPGRR